LKSYLTVCDNANHRNIQTTNLLLGFNFFGIFMKTQYLLFCLFAAIATSKVASAEVNFGKQTPTADQVIDALTPANPEASSTEDENNANSATKTRSIDMSRLNAAPKNKGKAKVNVPMAATQTRPQPESTKSALSVELIFAYNSADLTEAAKQQLKPIGEALSSGKLENLSFVVEGHTDAVGSQTYNKTLSEERAASVKQFLVSAYNLDTTRIQVVGKGKTDLLDPRNPSSEVNRRVRIIAIK
jgi:outer membrane protein OmpA-like peptidoglycan-associated protein